MSQPDAVLDAQVVVRRGAFTLDAALSAGAGEIVALLGPNGSGKSTLLGALSGMVPLVSGYVRVAGRTLEEAHGAGTPTRVPPERRRVGLLSQDALLFPHLSALENVAFGPRSQGVGRAAARRDARELLDAVGLAAYATHKPAALSGGQQQRVAIARALAARPDVLLLDEPLAALDVQSAALIRRMLVERLHATATTTVLVTHDVLDAITIARRCAILSNGRVVDDGPNDRVLGRPRTPFIAELAGMNLLHGVSDGAGGVVLAGGWRVASAAHATPVPRGDAAAATFSPAAVRIWLDDRDARDPVGSGVGAISATVDALEPAASGIRLRLAEHPDLAVVVPHSRVVEAELSPGEKIVVQIDPAEVAVHRWAG